MDSLLLSFVALYFIGVGTAGNGRSLVEDVIDDAGGFLPWLAVIMVLTVFANYGPTAKIGRWFAVLAALGFALHEWPELRAGFEAGYKAFSEQLSNYRLPASEQSNAKPQENAKSQETAATVLSKGVL